MNNCTFSLRRERQLLGLLCLICIGLMAGALYLQYVKHQAPCALCVVQRYLFTLIAIFAFLGIRMKSWRGVAVLELLIVLTATAGIVAAARHLYQQRYSVSCGYDSFQPVLDSLPFAHWLPGIFKVAGLCETIYPPILGIPLPGWSLLAFILTAVPVSVSLWRNRGKLAPSTTNGRH